MQCASGAEQSRPVEGVIKPHAPLASISELALYHLSEQTRVARIRLLTVERQISDDRDAMKVRTPNSLLGVRGTRFIVEVSK